MIRERDIEQCFAPFTQSKCFGPMILIGLCGHFWIGANSG